MDFNIDQVPCLTGWRHFQASCEVKTNVQQFVSSVLFSVTIVAYDWLCYQLDL